MINKMNIKNIVALLALLFAAFAFEGCVNDNEQTLREPVVRMTLPISLGPKAVGTEAATDSELSIHSLRVYAFSGGKLAGHYYYSGDAVSKISFLLDLKLYSSTTQSVMLYAIANESSFLRYSNITSLNASTSEADLKGMYFSFVDVESGLPMFYASESPLSLDVASDASAMPEDVVNGADHDGHTLLAQTVALNVERSIAKIDVFATKQSGENAELKITGVRMAAQGVRIRNFLFPQSTATLQTLQPHDTDLLFNMAASPLTVATTLPEGYDAASESEKSAMRTDKANYTAILAAPQYACENPYGSNNPLVADGSGKGSVILIDYEFNGIARSAAVNMPPMERNKHYPVYCLFNNEGKMSIDYIVADWDKDETNWGGELDFNYPTYSNPMLPLDQNAVRPFAKPTMWHSNTSNDEAGAFCCRFVMWGPVGQAWTAVVDGSASDYAVRVYDKNGSPQNDATVTVLDGLGANDWYTIKVVPLQPLKNGKQKSVKLRIVYTPSWMHHSDFLLINGEQESPAYTDSGTDPDAIIITQIEQPYN